MARIGSTTAAVAGQEPESWYRLAVYTDGWVEVPAAGRAAAYHRTDLRYLVTPLIAIALLVGLAVVVPRLPLNEMWEGIVWMVLGIGLIVVLVMAAGAMTRRSFARLNAALADRKQALRERATRGPLRRVDGAPRFTRATSAAQLASWLTPVRLIRADDVAELMLVTEGEGSVAVATFRDGTARAYRSPDRVLYRQLAKVDLAPGVLRHS